MKYRQTAIVVFLIGLVAAISLAQTRQPKTRPKPEALVQHVFVICVDGLTSRELKQGRLENLSAIQKSGSQVLNVESVYPSTFRPSYASLLTGLLPADHLVTGEYTFDEKLTTPRIPQTELRTETIISIAEKSSLSTLTFGLPFQRNSFPDQTSFSELLKQVVDRKPNLAIARLPELKDVIEKYGPESPETTAAASRIDTQIGELLAAIKSSGIENSSVVFIVSLHGFDRVSEEFYPNILLARKGYIKLDAKGEVTDWIAMAHSSGGTSAVYLKDQQSDESIENIRKLFVELLGQEHSPVWKITNRKDASRLGADPKAAFMIDGAPGVAISDSAAGRKLSGKSQIKATSGYLPSRSEVRGLILVSGPAIKGGSQIEYARIIDLAPTIARLLGLEMNSVRGRIISGVLKQQ